MTISVHSDHVECTIPSAVYDIDVVHKCFYWYGDQFSVDIESTLGRRIIVRLFPKMPMEQVDTVELSARIRIDLVDFKVRDIVTKETINVRDLLVAKAFSTFDQDPAE